MPLFNINEALAALDSARRGVSNRFGEVLDNPMAYLNRSLSRYAEENLPSRADMQDARSVMPGMADAAGKKLFNLASGGMGGVGRVAGHTVRNPQRLAYPDILGDPRAMVAQPEVLPEHPLLKRLFNVDRDDLWEMSGHGQRQGNVTEAPFQLSPKGAASAHDVMTERNALRLLDLIGESEKRPELHRPMASWYVMDPVYHRMVELFGKKEAMQRYRDFNTMTSMASSADEVVNELNRGTAAHMLMKQGRFDLFRDYAGLRNAERGADFPAQLQAVKPHPYSSTAHAIPMGKYVDQGVVNMTSAKVPSYIMASGVPDTGFQTQWPVGDSHWARLVGLPDVRNIGSKAVKDARGRPTGERMEVVPAAEGTREEMSVLAPWWRDMIAGQAGLESVPAQAVVWGAGSHATGVQTQLGAGKLEMLAMQIGRAAERMGVSPEQARDMILRGEAHAGWFRPGGR